MTTQYVITAGPTALSAAATKTLIEASTTANVPAEWISFDVSFDGTSATAAPIRVDLCTFSATGTGSAFTPKRLGQAVGTAQTTSKINDTVEPSTPTVLMSWFVPPTSGFSYQWPLGRELFHNVSTVQGIRVTTAAGVTANVVVNLTIEE